MRKWVIIFIILIGALLLVGFFSLDREDSAVEKFKELPSCVEEMPSCYEAAISGIDSDRLKNETFMNGYLNAILNSFSAKIENYVGADGYELACANCDFNRGGYIKLRGVDSEGADLSVYSRHGVCTSGGSDCGWSICVKTESDVLFKDVKTKTCNNLISKSYHEDDCIDRRGCYDNTTEVISRCFSGSYELLEEGMKTFSVVQLDDFYGSLVFPQNFDCINLGI